MSTIQWLNLLHGSPSFVIRIDPQDGRAMVLQVEVIPHDDGIYWVAGTTVIKRGDSIPSVFEIDTSSGGEFVAVYWKMNGTWISSSDKEKVFNVLGADERDVFPFDWSYSVKLAHDIFHD